MGGSRAWESGRQIFRAGKRGYITQRRIWKVPKRKSGRLVKSYWQPLFNLLTKILYYFKEYDMLYGIAKGGYTGGYNVIFITVNSFYSY